MQVDSRSQEAFSALHAIVDALHTTNTALVARLEHGQKHAQAQASQAVVNMRLWAYAHIGVYTVHGC